MFKVQRHKSYLLKKRTHTLYENALKKIMFLFIEAVISTKKSDLCSKDNKYNIYY